MRFFLGNKKRDLSDKFRDGEDLKKRQEQSDSLSSLSVEVFRRFKLTRVSKIVSMLVKKY